MAWVLDGVVVFLLVGLVGRIMFTRDLFEATVLFIAFGLTLALAWVRLGAPDVALAEAALGAGVTGALLLNAFRRLAGSMEGGYDEPVAGTGVLDRPREEGNRPLRWGLAAGVGALAAGLAWVLVVIPRAPARLPELVAERLPETGMENPVTGVLLSFRAYDTLLEVGVLVVAMVAVWSLDRGGREFARHPEEMAEDPVLEALARLVVPVAGITAVYLVWAGATRPGGAFQGGALLAGAGVLLAAAGIIRPITSAAPIIRVLGVFGLAFFTLLGLALMPWNGAFLAYPEGWSYPLILLVEAALTVSIAVILVELFVDVPAIPEADPELERVDPTGDPLGRAFAPDGALIRPPEEEP